MLISYFDTTKIWPDDIKFAVLFVNILLIVGLTTIDRNFSVIQKAGASRARVLERIMNLELSEIITLRYRGAKLDYFATGLYSVFVLAVMFLAGVIFDYSGIYYWLLLLAGIVGIVVLIVIRHYYIKIEYPSGKIDWTIDRLRCTRGDQIGITLTNLNTDDETFAAQTVMWEVRKEGEVTPVSGDQGIIKQKLVIPPNDSYTWLWPTENCCGVYRVYRLTLPKNELLPLKRKIIVKQKPKTTTEPTLVKLVKS